MGKCFAYVLRVFHLEKLPLLPFFASGARRQLACDRSGTFECALIWKHSEHNSSAIEGTQTKHRAHADIGPLQEFSRK
jgi:hypothetical protein